MTMREIALSDGVHVALVDDADFDLVSRYHWSFTPAGYALTFVQKEGRQYTLYMHRLIMGLTDRRDQADHANHNGLDNRRANLRRCSQSQNNANRRGVHCKSKTPYKGVETGRWGGYYAVLWVNGRRNRLGTFTNAEDAARAYDRAALAQWGEFARPNFPLERSA